jgi:hypothetical protein
MKDVVPNNRRIAASFFVDPLLNLNLNLIEEKKM